MKKNLVLLCLVVIVSLLLVGNAIAQALEPVELQPSFILMDGTEEVGLVYGLDYGWVILADGTLQYVCGCTNVEECTTPTPIIPPTDTPVPPTDTPIPPDDNGCNRGIGNGPEDCDPGNSSGQGDGQGRGSGEDKDESKGK